MAKKVKRRKLQKKNPNLIEAKHLIARPDRGALQYLKKPVWFMCVLHDDEVSFRFTFVDKPFDHWGIGFDYQIQGKKQVKAFVDFIRQTYEFSTKPQRRK